MNELASVVSNYPIHTFPTSPFESNQAYLQHLASQHLTHLTTQRNIASSRADARKRFIARHRMQSLIPRYCLDDAGPFKLFCDDMQPSNMLPDPETWRITAVLDLEFTNSMQAQFSYYPPSWLLLLGPDMWLEHHTFEGFVERYEPRLGKFLGALRMVEEEKRLPDETRLSDKMRESWATGRFWFDYGVRKSWDVDAVYWATLIGESEGDVLVERRMER